MEAPKDVKAASSKETDFTIYGFTREQCVEIILQDQKARSALFLASLVTSHCNFQPIFFQQCQVAVAGFAAFAIWSLCLFSVGSTLH